jgi:DNA polymerase III gamma/tau subunit
MSYCGKNISLKDVENSLYVLKEGNIQAFLDAIVNGNVEEVEKWLEKIESKGVDIFYLFNMLLRRIEIYIKEKIYPMEQIIGVMDVFYRAFMDMRAGVDGEVVLRTAAYKACMVKNLVKIEDVLEEIKTTNKSNKQGMGKEHKIEKKTTQSKGNLQTENFPVVKYILEEFDGKIIGRL